MERGRKEERGGGGKEEVDTQHLRSVLQCAIDTTYRTAFLCVISQLTFEQNMPAQRNPWLGRILFRTTS